MFKTCFKIDVIYSTQCSSLTKLNRCLAVYVSVGICISTYMYSMRCFRVITHHVDGTSFITIILMFWNRRNDNDALDIQLFVIHTWILSLTGRDEKYH